MSLLAATNIQWILTWLRISPALRSRKFLSTRKCHKGYCWYVDRYGREFDRSRTQGELPDCGQYSNKLDQDGKTGPT
ncbi:unnamed protein product [Cylicocyclus nassatus]|uniref:Thyroglobulin type-1 domain-containing protein n=1 Tax=Cylicocyclus nassatus TaxID=53992 RepID=A0AA36GZH1_CYLNA|nr:unnamed protein product [Cylicocyclus nassatus]